MAQRFPGPEGGRRPEPAFLPREGGRRAMERGSRASERWLLQGLREEAAGRFSRAEESYRLALLLGGPLPHLHFNLGNVLLARSRVDEALDEFRRSLDLDPSQAGCWNNLGNVLDELGRSGEAVGAYRRALSLTPPHRDAHYNLGETLFAAGALLEAVGHFRAYLDHDAHSPWAVRARERLEQSRALALRPGRRSL
jgi:tetratricopeptide (TPR) repeat protein